MKPLFILRVFFITLVVLPVISNAQKSKALKSADKAFKKEKYSEAIEFYKQAYSDLDDSTSAECLNIKPRIQFQIAECYRNMDVPKQEIIWYNKAIKSGYPDTQVNKHIAEATQEINKYNASSPIYYVMPTDTLKRPTQKKGVKIIQHAADTADKK